MRNINIRKSFYLNIILSTMILAGVLSCSNDKTAPTKNNKNTDVNKAIRAQWKIKNNATDQIINGRDSLERYLIQMGLNGSNQYGYYIRYERIKGAYADYYSGHPTLCDDLDMFNYKTIVYINDHPESVLVPLESPNARRDDLTPKMAEFLKSLISRIAAAYETQIHGEDDINRLYVQIGRPQLNDYSDPEYRKKTDLNLGNICSESDTNNCAHGCFFAQNGHARAIDTVFYKRSCRCH